MNATEMSMKIAKEDFMLHPPYRIDLFNPGSGVPLLEELRRLKAELGALDLAARSMLDALFHIELEPDPVHEEAVKRGFATLADPTHVLGAQMEQLTEGFERLDTFLRNQHAYDYEQVEIMYRPRRSKGKRGRGS